MISHVDISQMIFAILIFFFFNVMGLKKPVYLAIFCDRAVYRFEYFNIFMERTNDIYVTGNISDRHTIVRFSVDVYRIKKKKCMHMPRAKYAVCKIISNIKYAITHEWRTALIGNKSVSKYRN